jgi:predicted trehalose synthase
VHKLRGTGPRGSHSNIAPGCRYVNQRTAAARRVAKIHADNARERAKLAVREADRAEAEAWSNRCKTRASLPLDAFRRPRDTADLETRSGAEMPDAC